MADVEADGKDRLWKGMSTGLGNVLVDAHTKQPSYVHVPTMLGTV